MKPAVFTGHSLRPQVGGIIGMYTAQVSNGGMVRNSLPRRKRDAGTLTTGESSPKDLLQRRRSHGASGFVGCPPVWAGSPATAAGNRRLLHVRSVNSRWRPSLRASSASTPSSASRSRPAPPVSSPGACPSSTSRSVLPARTAPCPRSGCFAVGGARRLTVPASRRLAAPCPGTCPTPVEANRYRSAPARATPPLQFAWPPCFRRRRH